jgi:hypothetical protein
MRTQKSPEGKPWFWTIFVGDAPGIVSDRGYAATREQAMAVMSALPRKQTCAVQSEMSAKGQ